MVELYTMKDMNELVELLDVVGNKTDSVGQTVLVNTYFSKDKNSSRNSSGKVRAQVPVDVTSTHDKNYGITANCIDLFTVANPIFYEGGVIDSGFKEKNPNSPLVDLEGKALYEESLKQGFDPNETMGNHPYDWDCAGTHYKVGEKHELEWTHTSDNVSSKSGIHNLIKEHFDTLNDKYHTVMSCSSVPDSIKESYARMTDF